MTPDPAPLVERLKRRYAQPMPGGAILDLARLHRLIKCIRAELEDERKTER